MGGYRTNSGRTLDRQWGVGAKHALYREDGIFYMPLERFPGAYFDAHGYVLFQTELEYESCPLLKIGVRVNVTEGISKLPKYVKMR